MNPDLRPLRNWLGFTRRERRSSFILLILIIATIMVRFLFPEKNLSIEYFPLPAESYEPGNVYKTSGSELPPQQFKTDTIIKLTKGFKKKPDEKININSCDTSDLIRLPGIGPVLSVRIIRYRQLLGGYARVEQIKEVYGLPVETYELIRERLFADTSLISIININKADYKSLGRMPYFKRSEVAAILKYRELSGKISSMEDLTGNKLISEETADKVKPYLSFD